MAFPKEPTTAGRVVVVNFQIFQSLQSRKLGREVEDNVSAQDCEVRARRARRAIDWHIDRASHLDTFLERVTNLRNVIPVGEGA